MLFTLSNASVQVTAGKQIAMLYNAESCGKNYVKSFIKLQFTCLFVFFLNINAFSMYISFFSFPNC